MAKLIPVSAWCRDGKIPGAKRMGRAWWVPADAEYCAKPEPSENVELLEYIYGRRR